NRAKVGSIIRRGVAGQGFVRGADEDQRGAAHWGFRTELRELLEGLRAQPAVRHRVAELVEKDQEASIAIPELLAGKRAGKDLEECVFLISKRGGCND